MQGRRYLDRIVDLVGDFRDRAGPSLEAAAALCGEAVAAGGALHHFDTGHMKEEPIRRAGGFLGLHHLELHLEAEHALPPGRTAERSAMAQRYFYDREDLAPLLVEKSHLRAGDVLIQVSNSGKEPFTVGVGLEARARGVKLIALTSVEFSRSLEPKHSSGRRLFEIADAVVDMGSPPGDALLDIPGVRTPVGASSGVMTAVSLWALTCEITEALVARGIEPAIYRSVNLPDGFAFNREMEELYRKRGI
ncbi:MAG: sugar isomerase domain-containing protein [Planctomycetota bacterium]